MLMCSIHAPKSSKVPSNAKARARLSIKNGKQRLPAAVPEIRDERLVIDRIRQPEYPKLPDKQKALAMPLLLSKYLATKMIPGVVLKPMPKPVQMPKVANNVSTFWAKLLVLIPEK